MYESVKKEIPDFLNAAEIAYCDNLTHHRNRKSCLILLRNLKFFEFQNKVAVNSIDLSATCLASVQTQIEQYRGLSGDANRSFVTMDNEISFGKYIYQNFEINKLFLLIRCWDKLLVLRHNRTGAALELTAEYEDVSAYKLVHGPIKFQAAVEISFRHGGTTIKTDFNDEPHSEPIPQERAVERNENFKQLLERIRSAKSELLVHKSMTQKEFNRLKNTQTFGCNLLRSLKLEEKVLLARCGDVWLRFTANDELIVGVPLVNNASAAACAMLRNLKPVFQLPSEAATLSYSYRLFQLRQNFNDLQTLETFFQCMTQEELEHPTTDRWAAHTMAHLTSESFGVLCIKLPIAQLFALQTVPLFVFFELRRDISNINQKTLDFEQQVFIKQLDFKELLAKRRLHEVTFKCGDSLQQDLLAMSMASVETRLGITFTTQSDLEKFEKLLAQLFDFERIVRGVVVGAIEVDSESSDAAHVQDQPFAHILYYNRRQSSLWHGHLAMRRRNTHDDNKTEWQFYAPTQEKTCMFFELLLTELVLHECNIDDIEYPLHNAAPLRIAEWENALRMELNCALAQTKKDDELQRLLQLEMQTDLLAQTFAKTE